MKLKSYLEEKKYIRQLCHTRLFKFIIENNFHVEYHSKIFFTNSSNIMNFELRKFLLGVKVETDERMSLHMGGL